MSVDEGEGRGGRSLRMEVKDGRSMVVSMKGKVRGSVQGPGKETGLAIAVSCNWLVHRTRQERRR